ncbi:MAG TPA: hypothetical protein VEF55_07540, partial [Candidatus Binatia bacterium]|nr:hypothetical protein [Candidatus Binatia bacterium]
MRDMMAAPDASPPDTNPLRQAFRQIVPRPLRAFLHGAAKAVAGAPGFVLRQARRAGWAIADAMSTRRQPGLFFWHLKRAPGRFISGLRHANWEMQRSARHANWRMQRSARHTRWEMQRSARVMTNHAQALSRRRWRFALFGRRHEPALDQPFFGDALARMQSHDLGIRSIINIGAGSGGDTEFVQRAWPEARTLLIEMDAAFEDAYRDLKRAVPNLAWDICAAGPEDKLGRMQKTDI